MPALPTITVTDAQATRMLAAYGSPANYITWLTNAIIDYVTGSEFNKDVATYVQAADARRIQAKIDLQP